MNNLSNFLATEPSEFGAELGHKGGYIKFSNSGKRGGPKSFHISLEALAETLQDIQDHINKFQPLQTYEEKSWRDSGAECFTNDVAKATITVQTKPLFSTLSKLVKWANPDKYIGLSTDDQIVITKDTLSKTLQDLSLVIDLYTPKRSSTPKEASLQVIYFGTPGSGKSHRVKELTEGKKVHRTTFHPDSDYASFVGCYKPTMEGDEVKYSFTPQVFTEAYIDAWKNLEEEVYLMIEEINRGNCAQIFGDLFQLLDRKADGYSDYSIKADSDLRDYLYNQLGEENEGIKGGELCLPPNLRILATMNTSDQSLFPMDSAFKRRWDWEYVPVDYSDSVPSSRFIITLGDKQYRWIDFLQKVNEKILEITESEDKQMGNFFIKANVSETEFKSKVMFYLWNEVCRNEYGTNNPKNFFRTSKEAEFCFNELYKSDGLEKLHGFMMYLEIPLLSATKEAEEVVEQPEQS